MYEEPCKVTAMNVISAFHVVRRGQVVGERRSLFIRCLFVVGLRRAEISIYVPFWQNEHSLRPMEMRFHRMTSQANPAHMTLRRRREKSRLPSSACIELPLRQASQVGVWYGLGVA